MLRLAGSLARFWHGHAHLGEGLRWLERALLGSAAPQIRAKGFGTAGWLARNQGNYQRAAALLRESLALYRELADQQGLADVLDSLGDVAWDQGELAQAVGFYEEGLALFRRFGEQQRIGLSISSLGRVLVDQGDYARAVELFDESLRLLRGLNDQRGIAMVLYGLARAALGSGRGRAGGPFAASRAWRCSKAGEHLRERRMCGGAGLGGGSAWAAGTGSASAGGDRSAARLRGHYAAAGRPRALRAPDRDGARQGGRRSVRDRVGGRAGAAARSGDRGGTPEQRNRNQNREPRTNQQERGSRT